METIWETKLAVDIVRQCSLMRKSSLFWYQRQFKPNLFVCSWFANWNSQLLITKVIGRLKHHWLYKTEA